MARILVIDDQSAILKMLESILSQHHHVVTTAVDGFDGLDKFKTLAFDLIISDAVMPGGVSGFDVVKTVRATHPELPFILLTGKRERRDVERAIESGVDDYLVKPVDPDLLMAKVDSLLKKKSPTSVTFTEVSTSLEATFTNALRITGVSEVGLTLTSSQPIHPGSKIELTSPFFAQAGMPVPRLRVVTCAPVSADPTSSYQIRVQFIGMTESSLQPLRLWIRSRNLSHAG